MSNLPNPDDYRSPRAWRRAMFTALLFGIFVGGLIGAAMPGGGWG